MSLRPHSIEIDGGLLTNAGGANHGSGEVYVFLVDVIDEEDGRFGLWSGHDCSTAIIEAELARLDFGVVEPVRDRIGGAS